MHIIKFSFFIKSVFFEDKSDKVSLGIGSIIGFLWVRVFYRSKSESESDPVFLVCPEFLRRKYFWLWKRDFRCRLLYSRDRRINIIITNMNTPIIIPTKVPVAMPPLLGPEFSSKFTSIHEEQLVLLYKRWCIRKKSKNRKSFYGFTGFFNWGISNTKQWTLRLKRGYNLLAIVWMKRQIEFQENNQIKMFTVFKVSIVSK